MDISPENFTNDKSNVVEILTCEDNPFDNKLHILLTKFRIIASEKNEDVRIYIPELNKL